MAEGLSTYTANAILNAIGNNTAFAVTTAYVKLHTGAPGASAANNAATETTRKAVSFSAASGGSMVSDAAVTWTSIAGSEDATHFSLWDASTGGNFLLSGLVTANAYTATSTLNFATGQVTLSLTTGSAMSAYLANAILDAIGNNTSFAITTAYASLFTGAPGALGTSNAASDTTRKSMSFAAASGGSMDTDAAVTWNPITASGTEDATYLGVWDASSGGNYLGSVPISAAGYVNGDNYSFASGDITLSLPIAS